MAVKGTAVACVAVGSVLVFAGIKGYSIPQTVQDLVTGKTPLNQAQATPITGGVSGGSGSGSQIATDALQYKGAGYVWGGAPAQGTGNWDCSSFANWVIGHDLNMAIPGYTAGSYTGQSHGPTTISWLAWTGCTTVGHSGSVAQPGDLAVWQTHMGIAIGNGQMISAENPQDGTQVSGIDGFITGEILFIRRLNAVVVSTSSSGLANSSSNQQLGQQLAAARGWTGQQWTALDQLWQQESGWSNTATNPSSGAYGIAQANPPSKYPHAGQASGGSDPRTQIEWGLSYIAQRYGNPANALAHEQSQGWY